MDTAEIDGVLGEYAQAKNEGDVDRILALCQEDCFFENAALGQRIEGKEALRAFYTALFSVLPDYFGEFDGKAFAEDTAVVWGRFGGTTEGNFLGVEVEPGQRIEVPVTFVCGFRDGLLASDVGYFDMSALAGQAGVPQSAADAIDDELGGREAALALVANFKRLWATKDPELVAEIVAPDAVAYWSGLEPIDGVEYVERMRQMMNLAPDIENEVTGQAVDGDLVFISWRARATVGEQQVECNGIDRFRLRGKLADEVYAVFDTTPLREAAEAAGQDIGEVR